MDSRSKLLTAAAAEFARHGPRGTRVQAIVARAGVNERMIYHYFGSKDGLYRAVIEDQVHDLISAWYPKLDQAMTLPPREGIRFALFAFAEVFAARPLVGPLLTYEGLAGWDVRPKLTADMLPKQLRAIYRRGRDDGTFRSDVDFEVLYAVAMSALVGAPAMRGLLEDHPGGREGVLRQVIGLLLDGLTGTRPDRGESKA